uniref:Beta-glucosidase n=1 Tax=uncultured bacterium contig00001 TaxID=1181493 RepID=A0A806KF26_9BACT|nr:beta-glucosidase [uncultured bacterium contig00001]
MRFRTFATLLFSIATFSLPSSAQQSRINGAYPGNIALSRSAAPEGMVLVENDGALPLPANARVTLFGQAQNYIKGGGGSGDVTVEYVRSIYNGMMEKHVQGKIQLNPNVYAPGDPRHRRGAGEFALSQSDLKAARAFSQTAIVVFTRQSEEGSLEDADRHLEDYYMQPNELALVKKLDDAGFDIILVFNVCGLVDMTWTEDHKNIKASLITWQAGMEGGSAVADVLVGDSYPSGKLSSTIARKYEHYPSSGRIGEWGNPGSLFYREDVYVGYRYFATATDGYKEVKYEFGYGLGYTSFDITDAAFNADPQSGAITVTAKATNTGKRPGKEVLQAYCNAPDAKMHKPARALATFAKTKELAPGESQTLSMSFQIKDMASYDDTGATGNKSAYVLEAGDYEIYLGNSVKDAKLVGKYTQGETVVTEQLTAQMVPVEAFERLVDPTTGKMEKIESSDWKPTPGPIFQRVVPPIFRFPDPVFKPKEGGPYRLIDVHLGHCTIEQFVAQLTDQELANMSAGTRSRRFGGGSTGIIGGLPRLGIPPMETADGPAGLRWNDINTTAFPVGTMLACTWNLGLIEQIGKAIGDEMTVNNVDIWLAPGMNIHRNPLCSRNFEYYSEDPLLSGKAAAAVAKGVQSKGVGVMMKHFVGNEQQNFRVTAPPRGSNSVASERALREIYLKAFQIGIQEAEPWAVMGAYNMVNGTLACERYDLMTNILRDEWGFKGFVSTDWDFCGANDKNAAAGVAVKMMDAAKPQAVLDAINNGTLAKDQVRRNIAGMMDSAMRSAAFKGMLTAHKIASTGASRIDAANFTESTGGEWIRAGNSDPAAPITLAAIKDGSPGGRSVGSRFDAGLQAGSSLTYYLVIERGGNYSFSFNMSSNSAEPFGKYNILIDGVKAGEVSGADTGAWNEWKTFGPVPIQLQEGTHTLTLDIQDGGSQLRWIEAARIN